MAGTASPTNLLFALIIGVDVYQRSEYNLSRSVNDAKKVEDYLLHHHKPPVTPDRILFLQDSDATTRAIIDCLEYMYKDVAPRGRWRNKARPTHGDPILIYYAGHGSSLKVPTGWGHWKTSDPGKIQCLSPHDAAMDDTVKGVITDRTFGCLLERLADARGSNVTVILDCCHSGGGTRNPKAFPRYMDFPKDATIDPAYQREYRETQHPGGATHSGLSHFLNYGLKSHILLAACGPREYAYDGGFADALLKVLKSEDAHRLTYAELINRLDGLPGQTPRCEGDGKEVRLLFQTNQRSRRTYDVVGDGSSYKLMNVGTRFGSLKGDTFAIYKHDQAFMDGAERLAQVVLTDVREEHSAATLSGDQDGARIPKTGAVAVLLGVSNAFGVAVDIDETANPTLHARVHKALAQVFVESCDTPDPTASSQAPIALSSPSRACLSITEDPFDAEAVNFELLDARVQELGLGPLNGLVQGDERSLTYALRSAVSFFRHLGPAPAHPISPDDVLSASTSSSPSPQPNPLLRDCVVVRLHKLRASLGAPEHGHLAQVFTPINEQQPFVDDIRMLGTFRPVLTRDIRNATLYGLDIKNMTEHLYLYVWVFYFNCVTLEVSEFYSPPVASNDGRRSDPPLEPGKTLPLNYGDSGHPPLAFELPQGLTADGGFLRIFLSTRYADLKSLVQDPVVKPGRAKAPLTPRQISQLWDMWDAITIAVKLE
ncbi:unnamed protein product [Peniophora sp. CBMAI 1063]|nr:unnamed protein product [Peniophora sp. CBMAI 1063]